MSASRTSNDDFDNETDISFNAIENTIAYANEIIKKTPNLPEELKIGIKENIEECFLIMQKMASYPDDISSYDLMDDPKNMFEEENDLSATEIGTLLKRFIETLDYCFEAYGDGPAFFGEYAVCITPLCEV